MRFVEIYEAMKPSMYREYVKGWDKSRYEDIFMSGKYKTDKNGYRIFLDIKQEQPKERQHGDTERMISDHLKSIGYEVEDYIKGLAYKSDNPKRKIKIGKLLNKSNQTFFHYFQNDPVRQSTKSEFMVVISRHPYDIAGMSTNRGWESCMRLPDPDAPNRREIDYDEIEFNDHEGYSDHIAEMGYYSDNNGDWFKEGEEEEDEEGNPIPVGYDPYEIHWDDYYRWWMDNEIEFQQELLADEPDEGGEYHHYVASDVQYGTLIAYAVKRNDPDIKNPTCRVLIKPFLNIADSNKVVFGVENKVYGEPMTGFKETVLQWANEINQSKKLSGIFKLHSKLYGDGIKKTKAIVKDDDMIEHLQAIIDDKSLDSSDLEEFIDDHMDNKQIKALLANPDKFVELLGNNLSVNAIDKYIDVDKLSDEAKYDMIMKQRNILGKFKNLDDKFILKLINDGHYNIIGYLKEPSEKIQMAAINNSLNAMAYIRNPSERVQKFFDYVKKNPGDDAGIKARIGEPRPA